jgi:hypothetical protein
MAAKKVVFKLSLTQKQVDAFVSLLLYEYGGCGPKTDVACTILDLMEKQKIINLPGLHADVGPHPGRMQPHTDDLLRKHNVMLMAGEGSVLLVDSKTNLTVSAKRAAAYLSDLKKKPGFPEKELANHIAQYYGI